MIDLQTISEKLNECMLRIADLEEEVETLKKRSPRKHSFEKSPYFNYEVFYNHLRKKGWGMSKIQDAYNSASNYSKANGAKYLDWMQAVLNWDKRNSKSSINSNQLSKFDKINNNV